MIDRREFLQQVAAWSAGSAFAVPLLDLTSAWGQTAAPSTLAVARGKDYAGITAAAVEALGGMAKFVRRGDKVVVKPNIGWDRKPEQAANTHPEVVKALVKMCLDAGAKQVLVFDRPCNDARRTYPHSGIAPAVESIGDDRAKWKYVDRRLFVPVDIRNGKALDQWDLYQEAIEADCYINAPVAKHHSLTRLTLGLKNVMGVCGGRRGKIHQNIPEKLTDLNLAVAPKLTVVDATRILLRHGPSGGRLEDVEVKDTVIASADVVAADAYATTLFGLKPEQVKPTVAAARRGLGEMDLDKVKTIKA